LPAWKKYDLHPWNRKNTWRLHSKMLNLFGFIKVTAQWSIASLREVSSFLRLNALFKRF